MTRGSEARILHLACDAALTTAYSMLTAQHDGERRAPGGGSPSEARVAQREPAYPRSDEHPMKSPPSAVGRCIYCGSSDSLEDEHVVPYALGGTLVLPKASCRACATITGQFEQKFLREDAMRAVRAFRELPSRTRHVDAPTTLQAHVRLPDGSERVEVVSRENACLLLHMPIFDPPGYFNPNYKGGIQMSGYHTIGFGADPEALLRQYGASAMTIDGRIAPGAFARTVAKIAYSHAVASGQISSIRGEPFPVSAILGHSHDIGRWVGTLTKPNETHEQLHRVAYGIDSSEEAFMAEVQIFSDSETPSYGVLLGLAR